MTADTAAEQDIRGININKLAKGFADEPLVLKKFVTVSNTDARHIRWYSKTAGFLDSIETSGISGASQIANVDFSALPVVVEQDWTRENSYIRKYFVESPWISNEDIKDCDPDVLATNVRDLVLSVQNQVEQRIYAVINDTLGTGGNVNTAAATGTGWDDAVNGDPIQDLLTAKEEIKTYRYDPEGAILYIHPGDYTSLLQYLISVKGSSIPSFAAAKVETGVVLQILGLRVVVSTNASEDTALIFVPQRACTWKQFAGISTAIVTDPGIGKKIRVWEEGEALLTDPRAVHVVTDIKT